MANTKKKKRIRKRLSNIQSHEIGAVPFGANQRAFLVRKSQENGMGIKLDGLEEAHEKLGKLVKVAKSGTLSAEAQAKLGTDIHSVLGLLMDGEPAKETPVRGLVPSSVKEALEGAATDIDKFMASSSVIDLDVQDQFASVQDRINAALAKLDVEEVQTKGDEAQDESVEAKADEAEASDGAADGDGEKAPAAVEAKAEGEAAAPAEEQSATAAEETSAEAGTEDAESGEVAETPETPEAKPAEVNKTFGAADMRAMFQEMAKGFTASIEKAAAAAAVEAVKQVNKAHTGTPALPSAAPVEEYTDTGSADDGEVSEDDFTDFNEFLDHIEG